MRNFQFIIRILIVTGISSTALFVADSSALCSGFTGERYALIVQNIGPGLAMRYRSLLMEQGEVDEGKILCYGVDKPFAEVCIGRPTTEDVSTGFAELTGVLSEGDTLFVLFACHMQKGFLINNSLPYEELNTLIAAFPESVTVIVIVEGCYAAAALPILAAADLVYASAGPDEPCYGGWMHFFLDALGKDEALSEADADANGFVSFGEAFDYAADAERLSEWYANLSREVWPPADFHPTPFRTDGDFQYGFFMNAGAPAPF